jgi:hypothetical protein
MHAREQSAIREGTDVAADGELSDSELTREIGDADGSDAAQLVHDPLAPRQAERRRRVRLHDDLLRPACERVRLTIAGWNGCRGIRPSFHVLLCDSMRMCSSLVD